MRGGVANYEVIVLDNASEIETQDLLWSLKKRGLIDKLIFENENTFFARGNNLAAIFANKQSQYILLLNSDIEIIDPQWLEKIIAIHKQGATSLGLGMSEEGRFIADGYCFLIDKDLFKQFPMREDYEWWYSLVYTELQLLLNKYTIQAVSDYEELLHHFGGKSGDAWKKAKGMNIAENLYDKWLKKSKKQVQHIFSLSKEVGSSMSTYHMMRGVSPDGWCAPVVDLEIKTLNEGKVHIEGYYPNSLNGNEKGTIFVDKKKAYDFSINDNHFSFTFFAPKNKVIHISIQSNFSFSPPPPDIRELTFILSNISAY